MKRIELQRFALHKQQLLSMLVLFSLTLYIYVKIWTGTDQLGQASPTDPPIVTLALVLFFCAAICRSLLHLQIIRTLIRTYNFYLYLLLALFAIFFYFITGNSALILGAIAGFALQDEKPHTAIIGGGSLALFFFTLQLIAYSSGLIKEQIGDGWLRQSSTGETILRYALGFWYPTRAFAFLLPACFAVYYLNRSVTKMLLATLCLGYAITVFIATDTKSSIVILVVLCLSPLVETLVRKQKALAYLAILSYPGFYLISVISALTAGSNWNSTINRALSHRPGFWLRYINGGANLIGISNTNLQLQETSNPLDNYFLSPLIAGGILISAFLVIWNVAFMYVAYKNQNYKLIVIVLIFQLYGLSESQIQPVIMVFLPLMFSFVFSNVSLDDSTFQQSFKAKELEPICDK